MYGVYASGGSIYAATELGLNMAQLPSPPNPVPGPLPVLGVVSAFSVSRGLRRRLRGAGTASPSC